MVLVYSTGNYIQYPMINHNGKESEKGYVWITESLCCTAEINTTLPINYTLILFSKNSTNVHRNCIPESVIPWLCICLLILFLISIFASSKGWWYHLSSKLLSTLIFIGKEKPEWNYYSQRKTLISGNQKVKRIKCTSGLDSFLRPKLYFSKNSQIKVCSLIFKYFWTIVSNPQEQKHTNGSETISDLSWRRKMSLPPGQGIYYSV